ncbi:MAG: flagellar export chaperone FliS [Succinivibrionaceae bacterium]|jgi:flagellar protein FliS|nr:flagellar export chaperone FliS [Succinivibrionaceae bacterium]MCI6199946.1 flagellar export chaperone FliS [Pseudomonadota bacterium]MDD6546513.1 flagellar export chaperone FliS [Pseudomonadota bacterium]MDY3145666.1 flagellar export chaperone FliS [Succinivibrionaceae bacterium]MDY6274750.1 flagellar export chaperone FliS [Succinivibrionaceae bacterium]
MYGRNLKAYKKTSIDADLAVADPYRVIQLLYEGLLSSIAKARFAIEKKDIERKASEIDRAIRIVGALRAGVQYDPNNETQRKIGENLINMYAVWNDRLIRASAKLDVKPLDELTGYVVMVKNAWDKIPPSEREKAYEMQDARDRAKNQNPPQGAQ